MRELQSGAVAGGTVDSGLFIVIDATNHLQFNRTNGLPQNWIRSLCEDREGNLWVGAGSAGLVALRPGKVATLNPPDNWQGRAVLSLTGNDQNDLWIGTEGAGLYHLDHGLWRQFAEAAGLANPFVWSVTKDERGRIWAGTWGGGIFVGNEGRFDRLPGLEDIRAPITAVLHASNGVTWIGTDRGLLRYENGKTMEFGGAQGLDLPQVRTIAQGRDGTIWFGMFGGGLGRLSEGVLKQFRTADGLTSDFVQCLKIDDDGTVWIGTSGAGINRLRNGRIAAITRNQGLADNVICCLEEDAKGYLWISSHGGIMRVSKSDLNSCADGTTNAVACLTYGKGEGMPTLECMGGMQPAGCKTRDGRLWIPTTKGLVLVDPNEVKKNPLAPRVLIEEFRVDGRVQDADAAARRERLDVPPGQHQFDFQFTGLSFTVPEKVRFKCLLEGLNTDWTDVGNKRSINYPYLPPGTYTFRVIACNNDGVWNTEGASITFGVLPQIWQTVWFKTAVIMAGAVAVALGVLVLTRRRMRVKLERLERQRALERERTRIARDIHDDLGASLTRITMLSQSARAELDHSAAATDLDRIYDTARELTRAMDEIVWAVNPQHDTLDSLATYLGRFAQGFLAAAHIRCRLDVPMQLPAWPLTAEIRHNLFLAFKEAVNNAVKHAKTSEVRISMAIDSGEFALHVEDTGCGFVADHPERRSLDSAPSSGNGLANMRQRLAEIGGQCEIKSTPGSGTTIIFAVPVKIAMP